MLLFFILYLYIQINHWTHSMGNKPSDMIRFSCNSVVHWSVDYIHHTIRKKDPGTDYFWTRESEESELGRVSGEARGGGVRKRRLCPSDARERIIRWKIKLCECVRAEVWQWPFPCWLPSRRALGALPEACLPTPIAGGLWGGPVYMAREPLLLTTCNNSPTIYSQLLPIKGLQSIDGYLRLAWIQSLNGWLLKPNNPYSEVYYVIHQKQEDIMLTTPLKLHLHVSKVSNK